MGGVDDPGLHLLVVGGLYPALFDFGKMSESEIRETVISIRPYMADVFDIWTNSSMQTFGLTSVGMAIGHANIKRLIGEFASLAIWIN